MSSLASPRREVGADTSALPATVLRFCIGKNYVYVYFAGVLLQRYVRIKLKFNFDVARKCQWSFCATGLPTGNGLGFDSEVLLYRLRLTQTHTQTSKVVISANHCQWH